MGIPVGSKTVNLELRYRELRIVKDMSAMTGTIAITVETGYYDESNDWNRVDEDVVKLDGDRLWYVFGIKDSDLGLTDAPLGETLETALYGVVGGQIPLTAELDITVQDEFGTPIAEPFRVTNQAGSPVGFGTSGSTLELPLTLGGSIIIEKEGYETVTETLPVLQGPVSRTYVLTPL